LVGDSSKGDSYSYLPYSCSGLWLFHFPVLLFECEVPDLMNYCKVHALFCTVENKSCNCLQKRGRYGCSYISSRMQRGRLFEFGTVVSCSATTCRLFEFGTVVSCLATPVPLSRNHGCKFFIGYFVYYLNYMHLEFFIGYFVYYLNYMHLEVYLSCLQ
jgi:hypothetical protein